MPNVVIEPHYVLSLKLKHAGDSLRFWAPNATGYVGTVEAAGRYAGDEIRAWPKRYNNGVDALAVPCALVDASAVRAGKEHVVRRSRLAELTAAAARVASFQAHAAALSEPKPKPQGDREAAAAAPATPAPEVPHG